MSINTQFVATEQYNTPTPLPSLVDNRHFGNGFHEFDSSVSSAKHTKKGRVRINKLHWELIPRANDPSKTLQEKAINLLSVIEFKLRKTSLLLLNHAYLSRITKCKQDQNVNLLKQLADILDITFHAKLVVDGKIYRNCYAIKHTITGKQVIENSSININAPIPEEKVPARIKKDADRAEFFPTFSIYKKKEYKNRSNESNFVKVFDKENIHADHYLSEEKIEINQNNSNLTKRAPDNYTRMLIKQSKGRINNIASKSLQNWGARKEQIKFTTAKKLVSFYPLKDEEVGELQAKSGREFSKRAMNEILRDMSRKLQKAEKEPTFWSKKGFIAYMAKAFKYEKRDVVKISNETFQIRANESKEEKRARIEEEYLTELEYSLHVGSDWHFKKKLAAVLERSKAYELLTSIKTIEQTKEGKLRLILHRQVAITTLEKEIILNQAKATHERIENGEYKEIIDIELVVPAEKQYQQNQQHQRQHHYSDMKSINQERSSAVTGVAMVSGRIVGGEMQAKAEEPLPDTIWGGIRKRMRETYGYHTEKAWISRLEEETDEENKQIRLKVQSSFYKDYIETNYLDKIAQIAKEQGYSIKGQCIEYTPFKTHY